MLTFTTRNDKILSSKGGDKMVKRLIKKLVSAYQAKRLAKKNLLRNKHNQEQINLILKDLEERAY